MYKDLGNNLFRTSSSSFLHGVDHFYSISPLILTLMMILLNFMLGLFGIIYCLVNCIYIDLCVNKVKERRSAPWDDLSENLRVKCDFYYVVYV